MIEQKICTGGERAVITYKTSEIARLTGIHSNTVRLYEALQLIPAAERKSNGYRVFYEYHLEQVKLVRIALKVEILQNGLRKRAMDVIKASAQKDLEKAEALAQAYLKQIKKEQQNAEEAICIVTKTLASEMEKNGFAFQNSKLLTRKEAAQFLEISMDSLRNWEMNGLLTVKRKQNGYRVYGTDDLSRLKIIKALRCANYSLASILRMLTALSVNPDADVSREINTPRSDEEIVSVCDELLTSLHRAEENAIEMILQLNRMKLLI